MTIYMRNRSCSCPRCRVRVLLGPAILVTLGVLFLLEEYGIARFDDTWPVLLIVIGLLSFAARTASIEGHTPPRWVTNYIHRRDHYDPQQSEPDPGRPGAGPEVKP